VGSHLGSVTQNVEEYNSKNRSVQLFIATDLDSGDLHWSVQAVSSQENKRSTEQEPDSDINAVFNDGGNADACRRDEYTILPFLMENLDTREVGIMDHASNHLICYNGQDRVLSGNMSNDRPTFWNKTQQLSALKRLQSCKTRHGV